MRRCAVLTSLPARRYVHDRDSLSVHPAVKRQDFLITAAPESPWPADRRLTDTKVYQVRSDPIPVR